MIRWNERYIAVTVLGILTITACNSEEKQHAQVAASRDSVLTRQNDALQHEKDSLMVAMRGVFEAMNSIDSANALAGYKRSKNHQTEPLVPDEVQIRDRTLKALAHLRVVEAKLKSSVARVDQLSKENGQLSTELAQYRETASALQTKIETLTHDLEVANAKNDSLTASNHLLATTVDSFGVATRRGYYVAGPKRYLMEHNLVNEVGGSRFPFIVKMGSTLRPASAHMDTALFKSLDRMDTRIITLDSSKRYEVVSAQDLDGVDRSNADGRVFRGSIHIMDPRRFWRPSPFLILREL